ncbi:MAG: hypothetical protein M3O50_06100 [Myxococcota bacterium]|nr:hypothetical protein [Myxococcota bacterium]
MRVTVLSAILFGVLLWGWRDVRSRRERNSWKRPLSVAVVLVRLEPLDHDAIDAFHARVHALDARLEQERERYRHGAPRPFVLTFVGPVDGMAGPPQTSGEGWLAALKEGWALSRWAARVDHAANLDVGVYDSRVYVAARPPASRDRAMVEGESEQGGRVGAVEVELDVSMVDLALFVTAHELFHTLGATDKYDAAGRTLVPAGLVEPSRVPRWPQRFAEVMARNRPLAPGLETPPESLGELAIGEATADEIGWTR